MLNNRPLTENSTVSIYDYNYKRVIIGTIINELQDICGRGEKRTSGQSDLRINSTMTNLTDVNKLYIYLYL